MSRDPLELVSSQKAFAVGRVESSRSSAGGWVGRREEGFWGSFLLECIGRQAMAPRGLVWVLQFSSFPPPLYSDPSLTGWLAAITGKLRYPTSQTLRLSPESPPSLSHHPLVQCALPPSRARVVLIKQLPT